MQEIIRMPSWDPEGKEETVVDRGSGGAGFPEETSTVSNEFIIDPT